MELKFNMQLQMDTQVTIEIPNIKIIALITLYLHIGDKGEREINKEVSEYLRIEHFGKVKIGEEWRNIVANYRNMGIEIQDKIEDAVRDKYLEQINEAHLETLFHILELGYTIKLKD